MSAAHSDHIKGCWIYPHPREAAMIWAILTVLAIALALSYFDYSDELRYLK